MIERRDILTGISACGIGGIAGCVGGNNSAEEDTTTETETETESYNPDDYYGLPKCDGSKPIQLIDVQGTGGIIQNLTTDDLLVAVAHDDNGSNGDYCGNTILEGGSQGAYDTFGSNPENIYINARKDTSRNRDKVCNEIVGVVEGDRDGCVDPDTFRG